MPSLPFEDAEVLYHLLDNAENVLDCVVASVLLLAVLCWDNGLRVTDANRLSNLTLQGQ